MMNPDPRNEVLAFLTEISVDVVLALTSEDQALIETLSRQLQQYRSNALAKNDPDMATYFEVLHGLLQGEDVSSTADQLTGAYRAGYERILQEIDAAAEMTTEEFSFTEWLAEITSLVITTRKLGDEADRTALHNQLAEIGRHVPAEETQLHDFLAAAQAILQGQDTRALVLRLQSPYREAVLSMLQLLSAENTTDFVLQNLLDRIRHNTIVILQQGDAEARAALADSLTDVESKITSTDPAVAYLRPFIQNVRALLRGEEPPAPDYPLPADFAAAWQAILAAAQQT